MLLEDDLPVFEAQGHEVAVVIEVDELLARALVLLAREIGQLVIAIEVDLEGLCPRLMALEQLFLDVRLARRGHERRQPIQPADEFVGDRARLNAARPADQARHAEGAFPVGVLLAAERRRAGIGPGILMRPVIGGVEHDGVVRDAEVIHRLEDLADGGIVFDHAVRILGSGGQSRLIAMRFAHMRAKMHAGRIEPAEERFARPDLTLHEIDRGRRCLVVDRLHALSGERSGILDLAVSRGPEDTARSEALPELGVARIEAVFRIFFGVEVIEIAEELVEAVVGRQELVLVAEMVLAELAGAVAERLQEFGKRRVARLEADARAGKTDLGQAGAQGALARDEARTTGRAALLGIVVGEHHAFASNAVDVRRAVAHHAERIGAEIGLADVVAKDDQYVGEAPAASGCRPLRRLGLRDSWATGEACCRQRGATEQDAAAIESDVWASLRSTLWLFRTHDKLPRSDKNSG